MTQEHTSGVILGDVACGVYNYLCNTVQKHHTSKGSFESTCQVMEGHKVVNKNSKDQIIESLCLTVLYCYHL